MFYVDQSWLDAFVDGALRLANHTTCPGDPIKGEIKTSTNEYLRQSCAKFGLERATPLRWGFILRSKIVRAFPNLIIRQVMSDNILSEGQQLSNAKLGTNLARTAPKGQPVIRAMGEKTLCFCKARPPKNLKRLGVFGYRNHIITKDFRSVVSSMTKPSSLPSMPTQVRNRSATQHS